MYFIYSLELKQHKVPLNNYFPSCFLLWLVFADMWSTAVSFSYFGNLAHYWLKYETYIIPQKLLYHFLQSKRTETEVWMRRRHILDLMLLSPAWQHNRACIIIRTYPLLWNCLLPVKLMTGICTMTGGTQYNCNLSPTVSRCSRGHEENKWRDNKACH